MSYQLPSRQSVILLTCDKGGEHEGERITTICENLLCRTDCLCCSVCFQNKHATHSTIELDEFISDLEEKYASQLRKYALNLESELDGSRIVCADAVRSLQKYLDAKLNKLHTKFTNHLAESRSRIESEWTTAGQVIKRIRSINDKQELQAQLLEVLGQSTIVNGRIQSLGLQLLPNKGKYGDTINAITQSFILTLKNIHANVQEQYAKMCDPFKQPQHLTKDFYVKNGNTPRHSSTNNNHNSSSSSSKNTLNMTSSMNQSLTTANIIPTTPAIKVYDGALDAVVQQVGFRDKSDSMKSILKNKSNNNTHTSADNTPSNQSSTQQDPHLQFDIPVAQQSPAILRTSANGKLSPKTSFDRVLQPASSSHASKQQSQLQHQSSSFATMSMQQSTVSQNIPNLSQLQQAQASLYKQIHQQQLMLQQLSKVQEEQQIQLQSNENSNKGSSKMSQDNKHVLGAQQQSKIPVAAVNMATAVARVAAGLSSHQQRRDNNSINSNSYSNNNINQEKGSSSSSPSRLLYYSSIFSQHLQGKTNLQYTPFTSSIQSPAMSAIVGASSSTNRIAKITPQAATVSGSGMLLSHPASSMMGKLNARRPVASQQEQEGDTSSQTEFDIIDSDINQSRLKELPKSSERTYKFKFHKDFKHSCLDVFNSQQSIRGTSDNNQTRLALLSPCVESKPLQELHWLVRIQSCKSMAYSNPLAVGLCLKKYADKKQYAFIGEDSMSSNSGMMRSSSYSRLNTRLTADSVSQHGCYLLTSAGFIRNHTDLQQDMKRVLVRFDQGDTLECHFNPFRNYLKIKNQTSGLFCMINTQMTPGDALYPCVRISYCQDQVEVLQAEQNS